MPEKNGNLSPGVNFFQQPVNEKNGGLSPGFNFSNNQSMKKMVICHQELTFSNNQSMKKILGRHAVQPIGEKTTKVPKFEIPTEKILGVSSPLEPIGDIKSLRLSQPIQRQQPVGSLSQTLSLGQPIQTRSVSDQSLKNLEVSRPQLIKVPK